MRPLARAVLGGMLVSGCAADATGFHAILISPGLTEVYASSVSGPRAPVQEVISTDEAWRAFWQSWPAPETRPLIDFATQQLIVVALGTRGSTGYDVHIDSLQDIGATRTVFVTTYHPDARCAVGMMLTQPVHVVATAKRTTPIAFDVRDQAIAC